MNECPHCERQKQRVELWRQEAYRLSGSQWVGLTDEDRREIISGTERDDRGYVMALVEAKLKEKNT